MNAATDTLIVSFVATLMKQDEELVIKLQEDECTEYAWVNEFEAQSYDLIDGLYLELLHAAEL